MVEAEVLLKCGIFIESFWILQRIILTIQGHLYNSAC